jgi:hypothetical protein
MRHSRSCSFIAIVFGVVAAASLLACATTVDGTEEATVAPPASAEVHPTGEYLYPGVYIEETSFGSQTIPGVNTTPTSIPVKVVAFREDAGP